MALCLAVSIAGQALPLSLSGGEPGPGPSERSTGAWFEALQVCDGGSDFDGFFADHQWLPAEAALSPCLHEEAGEALSPGGDAARGYVRSVFRPPRPLPS